MTSNEIKIGERYLIRTTIEFQGQEFPSNDLAFETVVAKLSENEFLCRVDEDGCESNYCTVGK